MNSKKTVQWILGGLALLVLPLGGLLVGLVSLAATRLKRPLLDAVEANALHGGRMSMRDNSKCAIRSSPHSFRESNSWNLTASAPQDFASCAMSSARSTDPLWLTPTSATIRTTISPRAAAARR